MNIAIESTANADLSTRLQRLLDQKTKPPGSLGMLEELAHQLGMIQSATTPQLAQPQLLLFAADHGLARQGVSAYPQEVTGQMASNILEGGAAISVLTRQHHIDLTVVDCGIACALPPHPRLRNAKIMPHGTHDASAQAAMSEGECKRAIAVGMDAVRHAPGNAILLGELGIGNTSAASLLLARLAHLPIEECTGAGTGMHGMALEHKTNILRQVLHTHADARQPLQALAAFGGLEIAAMAGAALQAAQQRRVIVADGFVTGAAILVAAQLHPQVRDYCVFSHRSHERGHQHMLAALHAKPLLQLDLRLGEGSGAALAWPLLESACRILREMASFESANVSTQIVS